MRLDARHAEETPDLARVTDEVLDRRLSRTSGAPVAVALSGGGDSVALLLAAQAWARRVGRRLLVLTVDHRLRRESADWTSACAERARALGLEFQALLWDGEKPVTGVPAAARAARHRLLAAAARAAGAQVILLGHTADDILEARRMREAGATTPDPREWSPSPAWPDGRGVFLLRPLLGVRRHEIRTWLIARGGSWIDDPANTDPRYARARARDLGGPAPAPRLDEPPAARRLAEACGMDQAGVLHIARAALAGPGAELFTAAACLCAAGTSRPPQAGRLARLLTLLRCDGPVTATLAGARIEADAQEVRFLREPGEARRGGLAPVALRAGETAVWDGRFEVSATEPMIVRALGGVAGRLGKTERASIQGLVPKARAGLPATPDGRLVAARPLALERLRAACGTVTREAP